MVNEQQTQGPALVGVAGVALKGPWCRAAKRSQLDGEYRHDRTTRLDLDIAVRRGPKRIDQQLPRTLPFRR